MKNSSLLVAHSTVPKEIPETDTCLCSQLYGSEETFPKKYVSINHCASCHT